MPAIHSIVAAGGEGLRFGGETPKQLVPVLGRSILDWSIGRLVERTEQVVVALPERLLDDCPSSFRHHPRVVWVAGGRSRWRSVRRALEASCAGSGDLVAVHDGARPAVDAADLDALFAAGRATGAAILGRPVADTVKRVEADRIVGTIDRRTLFRAETPQVFRRELLERAFEAAARQGEEPTDEAAAVERLGDVDIVAVAARSPKPTTRACFLYIPNGVANNGWASTKLVTMGGSKS